MNQKLLQCAGGLLALLGLLLSGTACEQGQYMPGLTDQGTGVDQAAGSSDMLGPSPDFGPSVMTTIRSSHPETTALFPSPQTVRRSFVFDGGVFYSSIINCQLSHDFTGTKECPGPQGPGASPSRLGGWLLDFAGAQLGG
jgi:hypothetical protein